MFSFCPTEVCQCFNGWYGSDCSIGVNEAPQVDGIDDNGLCDITATDVCDTVVVSGDRFVEVSTLTCHLEYVEV